MQRAAKESAQKAISDREASQLERDQSRDRIESERDLITTEREAQVAPHIPPLHLPCISPTSPLHLPCIAPP